MKKDYLISIENKNRFSSESDETIRLQGANQDYLAGVLMILESMHGDRVTVTEIK